MNVTTHFALTDPYGDVLTLTHGDEQDSWLFAINTEVFADGSQYPDPGSTVVLTRAEAHELHDALGRALGLTNPTPTSPLTASKPYAGGTKTSRNSRRFDVV